MLLLTENRSFREQADTKKTQATSPWPRMVQKLSPRGNAIILLISGTEKYAIEIRKTY